MPRHATPVAARLVKQLVLPVYPDRCWFLDRTPGAGGYVHLQQGKRLIRAHRISYALFVGPIPEGMVLDHTCHNSDPECLGGVECLHRQCVNPRHLEAVPPRVNLQRAPRTHGNEAECPQGHPYDDANTYIDTRGHRRCRACARERFHAQKGSLSPDDPRHGTQTAYAGYSCRCERCVEAGRQYRLESERGR